MKRADIISGLFGLIFGSLSLAAATSAQADEFAEGRDLYFDICSKCHGVIMGDPVAWRPENLLTFTVVMPLGPNLSDIVGRTAGIVDGYVYSKAFSEMIQNPWVWDEPTLDLWLTDSQAFVNGSTMYLKADEDTRRKVIDYLKEFAPYKG